MDISERLERMEKRLKRTERYNRVLLAVLLSATVVMAVGAAKSKKVLEANEFRLVNESGHIGGRFTMDHNDPLLTLFDRRGAPRLFLGVSKKPQLAMSNGFGDAAIRLWVEDASSALGMYDRFGTLRASMVADRRSSLFLYDKAGKEFWGAKESRQ